MTTDALGNLICRKKGAKNGKKLLFAAHMDSIGVVATYIEDKGFIRFSQIGGLYVGDLLNIQVKFANGTRGVISYEEKTPLKDLTLDNLFIDIGAKVPRKRASWCRSVISLCTRHRGSSRTACCAVRIWTTVSAA